MQPAVSIIGAGPAGFALAAGLQRHGKSVLLYSHPTHLRHANHVKHNGHLRVSGLMQGSANLHVTSDMAEAVASSQIIILTVPSTGQETVLQELRKFSLRQHVIVAIPGNLFSLIADMEVGCVFETNLSPYSCRMDEGGLMVMGKKELVFIAALQQQNLNPAVYDTIGSLFPTGLKWCSSILEVCLSNVNGVFHPMMMLMNAGRIENTSGDFLLYRDGLTPAVANAMLAVDRVRIQIGDALGLRLKSAVDISNECYGQGFTSLVELAQSSPPHNKLRAPSSLENRNISEDVPDLLVAWHCLAEKLGIDAAPIKAVIVLAEMATGVDYFETGRNLRRLHLEHVSRAELIQRFGPVQEKVAQEKLVQEKPIQEKMAISSSRL
ncbi:6-phosphogluconate dehydrogenase C-terminal domain-like protein [Chaetomidium leptoderma]|uniref:6-phosphogluconate dehydrogenase C-terminal domain-like protein n=1 Tax=Chaetomidium leptoderma TaxID=669021 RepID=A0AAN6VCV2_9PEZI|nr:6-phosphogluconate dehydrogenase C-terminal domain-like protein [Chaetomidium leptoderma]